MSRRIEWIDVAKGIVILCIVASHMISCDSGIGLWFFSFHVPFFFIISGILLQNNKSWMDIKYNEVATLKIKKFMWPYLTFSLFTIVIASICKDERIIEYVVSFFSLDGIMTLWYLPAIMFAEVIFIFLYKRFKEKIVLIYIILTIFTICFSYLVQNDILNIDNVIVKIYNVVNRSLQGSIFIAIGYLLGKIIRKNDLSVRKRLIFAFCFGIVNVILYRFNYVDLRTSSIGNPILFYINAISGSLLIIIVSTLIDNRFKVISYLGKHSLIVFSTHLNFRLTVGCKKMLIGLNIFAREKISALCAFIIVILIEYVIIFLVNRYLKWIIDYRELPKCKKKKVV